jgi:hypothetical protein
LNHQWLLCTLIGLWLLCFSDSSAAALHFGLMILTGLYLNARIAVAEFLAGIKNQCGYLLFDFMGCLSFPAPGLPIMDFTIVALVLKSNRVQSLYHPATKPKKLFQKALG